MMTKAAQRHFATPFIVALLLLGLLFGASTAAGASWKFAAPARLAQTAAEATSITATWQSVKDAPRYRIQLSRNANMSGATYHRFYGTSGKISNLDKGAKYYARIRVISKDGANLSDYTVAPVEMFTSMQVPTGLKATQKTTTSLAFDWQAIKDAPRYRIQLSTSSSMSGATYHRFYGTTGTITGLEENTTYYARIRVINDDGLNLSSYSGQPVRHDTDGVPATSFSFAPPPGLASPEQAKTMLSWDWEDVPKAVNYRIQLSTAQSMSNATYHRFSSSRGQIGGLKSGTRYYARVRVITADGVNLSDYSSAVPATTTTAGFALASPLNHRALETGVTSVKLSWDAVSGAQRYRLQISESADWADARYVRVTPTSYTLEELDPGTDYFIRVRVITADGANLSAYGSTVKVATPSKSGPLKVASFNIKCENCLTPESSRPVDELPWEDRRTAVVQSVVSTMPDVIGFQEAAQAWIEDNGKTINLAQFEDLEDRLNAAGPAYRVTNGHRNNCENSTTPTGCRYKDQGASKGTKIIYNADANSLIAQGSEKLKQCSGCNERYLAWAILKQKSTGKEYFFANTHLEPGVDHYTLRSDQAKQALAEVNAKNTEDLPVIWVGDFNSTRYATPTNAPYDVVVGSGLVDPLGHTYRSPTISPKATVEKRILAHCNSYSGFDRSLRCYGADENGNMMDYIFTSPMRVTQWETVVDLDSSGTISGIIPADHNMIQASVILP